MLGLGSALLLLAVVAGLLAVVSRQQAAEARDRQQEAAVAADARRLAAASLNEEQLDLALLQAVEAVRTEPGSETHGALLSLLARTPDLLLQRRAETPFLRADASPDGSVVAVAECDPRVIGLDAVTGEELWAREVPEQGHAFALAGGPTGLPGDRLDGRRGQCRAPVGRRHREGQCGPSMPKDLEGMVGEGDTDIADAVWLADGRRAVVLTSDPPGRRVADRQAAAGRQSYEPGPTAGLLRSWPDGRVSYEAPFDVGHVLDVDRPGSTRTLPYSVASVSPDGGLVLTADRSRPDRVRLRLRDSRTYEPRGEEITVSSFDGGVDWSQDGATAGDRCRASRCRCGTAAVASSASWPAPTAAR